MRALVCIWRPGLFYNKAGVVFPALRGPCGSLKLLLDRYPLQKASSGVRPRAIPRIGWRRGSYGANPHFSKFCDAKAILGKKVSCRKGLACARRVHPVRQSVFRP